jgi:hypothetical protein
MSAEHGTGPDSDLANPGDVLPSPFDNVGADIVSQAVLAAITGSPPVGMALAGLFPILERASRNAVQEIHAARRRRRAVTLVSAASSAGPQRAELLHRIENNPSLGGLVEDALNAGENSMYPSRIRGLGAALAAGVLADDTDLVDVEHMVIQTLGRLERPHLRVLEVMTARKDGTVTARRGRWAQPDLFAMLLPLRPVLHRLLADLESVGVLRNQFQIENLNTTMRTFNITDNKQHNWWTVTGFGIRCMDRLYDVGLAEDLEQWEGSGQSAPVQYNVGQWTMTRE